MLVFPPCKVKLRIELKLPDVKNLIAAVREAFVELVN